MQRWCVEKDWEKHSEKGEGRTLNGGHEWWKSGKRPIVEGSGGDQGSMNGYIVPAKDPSPPTAPSATSSIFNRRSQSLGVF